MFQKVKTVVIIHRKIAIAVLAVSLLVVGATGYAAANSKQDVVAPVGIVQPSARDGSQQLEKPNVSTEQAAVAAASTTSVKSATPAAPKTAVVQPQPGQAKQTPQQVADYEAVERARVGALRSITITGGSDTLVSFTTAGAHANGYLIAWQPLTATSSTAAAGSAKSGGSLRFTANGQEGSGLLFNLKFSFGEYKVVICQDLGGGCGITSNPIYLTVAPNHGNCTPTPTTMCPITGSVMTYHF